MPNMSIVGDDPNNQIDRFYREVVRWLESSAYGLPEPWIEELERAALPGTGRIEWHF
jgi:hypothetical protein